MEPQLSKREYELLEWAGTHGLLYSALSKEDRSAMLRLLAFGLVEPGENPIYKHYNVFDVLYEKCCYYGHKYFKKFKAAVRPFLPFLIGIVLGHFLRLFLFG